MLFACTTVTSFKHLPILTILFKALLFLFHSLAETLLGAINSLSRTIIFFLKNKKKKGTLIPVWVLRLYKRIPLNVIYHGYYYYTLWFIEHFNDPIEPQSKMKCYRFKCTKNKWTNLLLILMFKKSFRFYDVLTIKVSKIIYGFYTTSVFLSMVKYRKLYLQKRKRT